MVQQAGLILLIFCVDLMKKWCKLRGRASAAAKAVSRSEIGLGSTGRAGNAEKEGYTGRRSCTGWLGPSASLGASMVRGRRQVMVKGSQTACLFVLASLLGCQSSS